MHHAADPLVAPVTAIGGGGELALRVENDKQPRWWTLEPDVPAGRLGVTLANDARRDRARHQRRKVAIGAAGVLDRDEVVVGRHSELLHHAREQHEFGLAFDRDDEVRVRRKAELGQQGVESAAALQPVVERPASPRRGLRQRRRATRAMKIVVVEKEKLGARPQLERGAGVARQALPLLRLAGGDDFGPGAERINAMRPPMQGLGGVLDPCGVDAEDAQRPQQRARPSPAVERDEVLLARQAQAMEDARVVRRLEQRRSDGGGA
jgi:hypothetical protein